MNKFLETIESTLDAFILQTSMEPNKTAIEIDDTTITYLELLTNAKSIAALIQQSNGSNARIGVLLQNPIQAITSMLGIAMANSAWVYLDSNYPVNRINEIVIDISPALIITSSEELIKMPELEFKKFIEIPIDTPEIDELNIKQNLDIAYILYTSGSTGKPKGVFQSHKNLWQHILRYICSININRNDKVSLIASLGVDAALMDIFGALCAGASLHIRTISIDGVESLPGWINSKKITIYHSTPTVFRALCTELAVDFNFETVSRVVLGGEIATHTDLINFQSHFNPSAILVNGFGPSECTVATQAIFTSNTIVTPGVLPIGEALPGIKILLIDDQGKLSKTQGEIAIESDAIALGYWNFPEATSRAFLNRKTDNPVRIYLTGDIGEYVPGRGIVLQGRKDAQLKIRGNRVESGDIESIIRAIYPIQQVALIKTHNNVGDEILVAVIVPQNKKSIDTDVIMTALKTRLPQFAIPARLFIQEKMPLTPSGKVDRRSLTAELMSNPLNRDLEPRISPQGDTENWLAQQWSLLLGAKLLSRESDFFWLGGHSLLAIKLLSQIKNQFGINLSPSTFFSAPKLYQVASLIDNALVTEDHLAKKNTPVIQNQAREFIRDTSRQQEQLWISTQFSENQPINQIIHAIKLDGELNINKLRESLQFIVESHESLRTFVSLSKNGQLLRDFSEEVCFELIREVDSRHKVTVDEFFIFRHIDAIQEKLSKINSAPMSIRIIKIGENSHILILVASHTSLDGISIRIILNQWQDLYNKLLMGTLIAPIEFHQRQYSEYIIWQKQWATSENYREQAAWWISNLKDAQPLGLSLSPHLSNNTYYAANRHVFTLGKELTLQLRTFNRCYSITTYMMALSVYALLLKRHFDRDDICIATPVANRLPSEFDETIGLFVNTVIMRVLIDENLSGLATVELIRAIVSEALDRQQFPFGEILRGLEVRHDAHDKPFFEVMLSVQNLDSIHFENTALRSTTIDLPSKTVTSNLCLTIFEEQEEMTCHFEYPTQLFDSNRIEKMASHFISLLSNLVFNPEAQLSSLQMFSTYEKLSLIQGVSLNGCYELDTPITKLFNQTAQRMLPQTAVIYGDISLTYEQILYASTQLAKRIRQAIRIHGQLIPLIITKNEKLPIALLGILKSGNAFVPIDACWPKKRIETALRQCEAKYIVIDAEVTSSINREKFICFSVDDEDLAPPPNIQLEEECTPSPEEMIYGIFTSGSTGTPKLAIIKHSGIANRFAWMTNQFAEHDAPVTLVTTPAIYDSAVWQLLWPLTCGGKVVIPTEDPVVTCEEILKLIDKHKITIIDFVPSTFDLFVLALESMQDIASVLIALKFIILGGESVRPETILRFTNLSPKTNLINLYGPTEASIGCIYSTLNNAQPPYPIGNPIPNVQVMLLDKLQRLVPQGAVGEIYLMGKCLGKGYWNNIKSTSESFVANPYRHFGGGEIAYKTGDLGQIREDGKIYFIGRADDQIKIRGVRIDPAEIERIICRYQGVTAAIVDTCNDNKLVSRLCAWVQPSVPAGLREHCIEHLPISFIPEFFINAHALPLAASGKIDRKRLRTTVLPSPVIQQNEEQDLTPNEQVIVNAWRKLLKIPHVPLDQSFFELGGNSLLAIQLLTILKKTFQPSINIVDIFRYPTISTFSKQFP